MAYKDVEFSLRRKRITIGISEDVEFKIVIAILKKKLPEIKLLYKNNQPEISVLGREFSNKERSYIQKTVGKFFDADINFSSAKMLGLYSIRKPFNRDIEVSKTKYYRHSLRSGQRIEFEGSIIVLGDVNYGAEVIAGENIVVLGVLRGLAHAGAKGNKDAIISASAIQTSQVRISNIVKEFQRGEFEDAIIKTNVYLNEKDEIIVE